MLGLIGPNGSGKTTLFECLAGVLPYDAGTIRIDGQSLSPRDRASTIFYLPDAIAPWPSQTVALGARLHARVLRAPDPASRCGEPRAGDRAARPRRRCSMRRSAPCPKGSASAPCWRSACSRRTRCCWPTSRSTASTCGRRAKSARRFARTREGGRTIFLSIHQIADAERVCDRFVLLSGGRVCGEGTRPRARRTGSATQSATEPGRHFPCAYVRPHSSGSSRRSGASCCRRARGG